MAAWKGGHKGIIQWAMDLLVLTKYLAHGGQIKI